LTSRLRKGSSSRRTRGGGKANIGTTERRQKHLRVPAGPSSSSDHEHA
jgi:hypothetical protein